MIVLVSEAGRVSVREARTEAAEEPQSLEKNGEEFREARTEAAGLNF